jgi:uncharacterized protein (TIGR02284 family)
MATIQERTDPLNSLLRGELSAVETYQQALDKVGNDPNAYELRRIASEHREAADTLRQHILNRGGQPADSSGAWGSWAKTVEGTAKIFGNTAAMKALKEGEEHGIKEYQDALSDKNLDPECRQLISATLLPRTQSHIPILDQLMQSK